MTKKLMIIIASLVLVIIFSFMYYKQTHLSIWGFSFAKSGIKDITIQTEYHSFLITDSNQVSKILEATSKMRKYSKIESFPPQAKMEHYHKLLIRTKDNITYGGSIWVMDNNTVMDSNGYYWGVDYNKLKATLNASIKKAKLLY